MSNDNGGPAFPTASSEWTNERNGDTGGEPAQEGMTLRDYFAAKAMQAAIHAAISGGANIGDSKIASLSYVMASAMLAERDKP